MKKQLFQVQRTARFYQLGELTVSTQRVWVVLHGYGMLAKYFIRKFSFLESENTAVIAPEGMQRFYLNGTSGRVGASWMTKDDREVDIQDNMNFLNQLMNEVYQKCGEQVEVVLLGFSQGCPTAARYAMQAKKLPSVFIGYASDIPKDTLTPDYVDIWSKMNVFLAVGDQDPYIPSERILPHLERVKNTIPDLHFVPYEGDHRIFEKPLQQIEQLWELTSEKP